MSEEELQALMDLIIYAGDGKSCAMEAIRAAKKGDFSLADEKLLAAEKALQQSHRSQTAMLGQEATGLAMKPSMLLIHAQDHLMTSITFNDLAKEIVDLYRQQK